MTDDPTIQALNLQYLGRDCPTDVISFHQSADVPWPTGTQKLPAHQPPIVLGDVVISRDTAIRQAADNGLTLEQELSLLTIHGMLHLLGYEDETPARKKKMHARQWEILQGLYPELT